MNSITHIMVNGENADSIPALDRGLAYGDGVFETMYVLNQRIVLWEYHYQRLSLGLSYLGIDVDHCQLLDYVTKALKNFSIQPGMLKLMVTRGEGGYGYSPPDVVRPNIITIGKYIDDKNNIAKVDQGVTVHCCKQVLPSIEAIAGLKTLNQLPYVLACQERQGLDIDEGLLFTQSGNLIEATARNIFLVKSNKLYTPLLNECGVAGVMQRLLVENIAVSAGISIHHKVLTKQDLWQADEVLLSNSISHLWPVVACEDKQWLIGDVTKKLQKMVQRFLHEEIFLSLSVKSEK